MKYIHFHCRHPVQIAFNNFHRHEMTACIDHQTAPRKPGLVLNDDCGYGKPLRRDFDKLEKGLQAAHDAQRRGAAQLSAGGGDFERVRLIFPEFLHFLSWVIAAHCEFRSAHVIAIANAEIERRRPGVTTQVAEKNFNCLPQVAIGAVVQSDCEGRLNQ